MCGPPGRRQRPSSRQATNSSRSGSKQAPQLPRAGLSQGPETRSTRPFPFTTRLNHDPFDLIERDLFGRAVEELGGARGLVCGDGLGVFDRAAV